MSDREQAPDEEMSLLDSRIRSCTLCKLANTRTKAVPGEGTLRPKIIFVGEAPGRNEDLAGRPFVGAGGKLLDSLLSKAGLERREVYITNIVKCRPPRNRKPDKKDEILVCTSNYLERQIELLDPKLICTLGATALEYFTGKKVMSESHGKLLTTKSGRALLPTYHPASIFRNRSLRELLEEDLKKIPEILDDLGWSRKLDAG